MKIIRRNTIIKKKTVKFVDVYVKNWILTSKWIRGTSVYDTCIKLIGSYLNFKHQFKIFKH